MSISKLTRVIRVRTADGVTTEHSYKLTNDYNESVVAKRIAASMNGKSNKLVLTNPLIVYRTSHIVAVTLDWSAEESSQLQNENENAALRQETERRAIGFLQGRQ